MTQISRRLVLAGAAAAAAAPRALARTKIDLERRALAALEQKSGGRLGVFAIDGNTNSWIAHRADERFAMCSTFKLPLAAAILQRADRGALSLDTVVTYTKEDMVFYAPVTEKNIGKGMTVGALAEAAQKQSDNVAANLLLKQIGGPQGFTQFFRDIDDTVTRLDRYEPAMNDVPAGDERDTTTPRAMAETARKLLMGDVLAAGSRAILADWMIDTKTGLKRLRAGLPPAWKAGDKTGTYLGDDGGKYNDVAVAWPPGRAPVIIACYYNTPVKSETMRDGDQAVLAEVGRIVTTWLG